MTVGNSEVRIGNITPDGTGDLTIPLNVNGTTTLGLSTSFTYRTDGK